MQQLRHPNIVSFFGMAVDNQKGLLLMELCDGRDLGSALKLCDGSGTRLFGWHRHGCRIASEVATAVNYLHSQVCLCLCGEAASLLGPAMAPAGCLAGTLKGAPLDLSKPVASIVPAEPSRCAHGYQKHQCVPRFARRFGRAVLHCA